MCYFLSHFLETIGVICSSYFPIHSPPSRHERFSHLTSSNRFPRVFAPPAQHPACPDLTLSFQRSAGASLHEEPSEPAGASPSLDHRLPHNSNVPRQGFSGYAWEAQTLQKLRFGVFGPFFDTFGQLRNCWAVSTLCGIVGQTRFSTVFGFFVFFRHLHLGYY